MASLIHVRWLCRLSRLITGVVLVQQVLFQGTAPRGASNLAAPPLQAAGPPAEPASAQQARILGGSESAQGQAAALPQLHRPLWQPDVHPVALADKALPSREAAAGASTAAVNKGASMEQPPVQKEPVAQQSAAASEADPLAAEGVQALKPSMKRANRKVGASLAAAAAEQPGHCRGGKRRLKEADGASGSEVSLSCDEVLSSSSEDDDTEEQRSRPARKKASAKRQKSGDAAAAKGPTVAELKARWALPCCPLWRMHHCGDPLWRPLGIRHARGCT